MIVFTLGGDSQIKILPNTPGNKWHIKMVQGTHGTDSHIKWYKIQSVQKAK
jgi:hypothetical protein